MFTIMTSQTKNQSNKILSNYIKTKCNNTKNIKINYYNNIYTKLQ